MEEKTLKLAQELRDIFFTRLCEVSKYKYTPAPWEKVPEAERAGWIALAQRVDSLVKEAS